MKARILIIGTIIAVASLLSDCEKERDTTPHGCPTCADNVTWDGYGDWTLQEEGFNGSSNGYGYDGGETYTHLIPDCGWSIWHGNAGGVGNVYIAQSCNEGVLFLWSYGRFSTINLQEGWTGQTKEGIKIGDSRENFLATYPQFIYHGYYGGSVPYIDPDSTMLDYDYKDKNGLKGYVQATFSKEEKKLVHLLIGKYHW